MRYSIVTFGCRVNQADSLAIEEQLRLNGGSPAAEAEADLIVVNTCSVTCSADQGARQTVRRIGRTNPHAAIVVTGCYATRAPEALSALPNVVRVVPNQYKLEFLSPVRSVRPQPDEIGDGSCGAVIEPGVAGRTAFTLAVQTGCSEPCSYCIIPSTRGTPRSQPVETVLREVERVVAAGFKEIALTGVHLGSYGRDLAQAPSLLTLLRALSELPAAGDVLFRISSLEPMDCTPAIVDLAATSGRFAPHFHLPLQHASTQILEAMRRPYTIEQYAALVDDIRRRIPAASIGSDILVGFPGETDEDFGQLAAYLETSPLTHLHVFPYSDRPGTAASVMSNKVAGGVVRERTRRLREISARLATAFIERQVGTVQRALTLEDGTLAVTGNYLKVRIPSGRVRNEWVNVKVVEAGAQPRGTVV